MVKQMVFIRKNKGMTHDESVEYHRNVHAPLAARVLGDEMKLLKRYVAYYFAETPDMPFDMVVEQWFDDEGWNKMKEFRQTPEYQVLRTDTDKMVDRDTVISLTFEENVII